MRYAASAGGIRTPLPPIPHLGNVAGIRQTQSAARRSRRNSSVSTAATVTRRGSVGGAVQPRGGCSLERESEPHREHHVYQSQSSHSPTDSPHSSGSNEKIDKESKAMTQLMNRAAFYRNYETCTTLGKGNFSRVYLLQDRDGSNKCAVKEIDKERMSGRLEYVYNEVNILMDCEHENICKLVEAFESPSYFFLFGDLFEFIKLTGIPGEANCACITYQLASALAYIHGKGVVHRDVKPENILIVSESWVKLTDFGLACEVLGPLHRVCGTPTYVAPEVISEQGYGVEVDVWSLGVVLHIMLIGCAPFRAPHRSQLFKLIRAAALRFDLPRWAQISTGAQTTVRRMLQANPKRRISASDLLEDQWIQGFFTYQ